MKYIVVLLFLASCGPQEPTMQYDRYGAAITPEYLEQQNIMKEEAIAADIRIAGMRRLNREMEKQRRGY